jgi:uncharacterized membrane protein
VEPIVLVTLKDAAGWLASFPREVAVFITATLPILELRGAIPLGLIHYSMPTIETYLIAVAGNFLPVVPILLLLEPVSNLLRRNRLFDRFFTWLFARTRKRGKLIERYEAIGLTLFVAIPLPVTGAWTGAVAAYIFGVRRRYAALCIMGGILIAGVVVTLASKGVIGLRNLIVID